MLFNLSSRTAPWKVYSKNTNTRPACLPKTISLSLKDNLCFSSRQGWSKLILFRREIHNFCLFVFLVLVSSKNVRNRGAKLLSSLSFMWATSEGPVCLSEGTHISSSQLSTFRHYAHVTHVQPEDVSYLLCFQSIWREWCHLPFLRDWSSK